jgi:hypothetical protein
MIVVDTNVASELMRPVLAAVGGTPQKSVSSSPASLVGELLDPDA